MLNIKEQAITPANTIAIKLWQCSEALRDISNILKGAENLKSEQERKRRIKVLSTPLYSFCKTIFDLCNEFESSPSWKNLLTPDQRKEIHKLKLKFCTLVPLGKQMPLKEHRDKLSAAKGNTG